jgi:hypothetical protein
VVGAGAGAVAGAVVGTVAAWVDVSAVAAVAALSGPGAVVVVDVAGDESPGRTRAPRESLEGVPAIPLAWAPVPRATRFGLPAVATSSAIRARETARMTHQLGRLRATRGRRRSVV